MLENSVPGLRCCNLSKREDFKLLFLHWSSTLNGLLSMRVSKGSAETVFLTDVQICLNSELASL